MALTHLAEVSRTSGQMVILGPGIYPALAVALVLLHGVRVVGTSDRVAEGWLQARGFTPNERAVAEVRTYLVRLRVARFVGALAFLGLALVSWTVLAIPIGVVSGPYLLSVLGAELLTPRPRRGRERTASLARRSADFFAPRRAVLAVRVLLLVGVLLAGIAAALYEPAQGSVHMGLLVVGAVVFEGCLRTISGRGLPTAQADLARDTAVRVASSHTAAAAGLSFAGFGALYSLVLIVHHTPVGWWGRPLANQALTWGSIAVIAVVTRLLQPVRAWRPRGV